MPMTLQYGSTSFAFLLKNFGGLAFATNIGVDKAVINITKYSIIKV